MTKWGIEDITPALRNSPPDRRNQVWKDWYDSLINQLEDDDYRFMNYGYQGLEKLELEPADEANRIFIELYQLTLGDTNLTSKKVLDISSGLGGGASWISRWHQPSSLIGMDISSEAVSLCNKWYGSQQNLRFIVGDAESLPFPNASFDIVYSVESSHCYANLDAFLREVFRVLRADGVLCWSDFQSRASMEKIISRFEDTGFTIISSKDITNGVLRSLEFVYKAISEDTLHAKRVIWGGNLESLQDVILEFAGGDRSYHCFRLSRNNVVVSRT
jgi:ubiquinone/menaquinone biosynthesis C-methylase UbiE